MNTIVKQKSFLTDRPVGILMVFIAAIVFGYFSLSSLPVTLMPELSYPTITVRTQYPGAAPEEVENDISRKIEEALGVVSGLKKSTSISRAGVSDVVLNFVWGVDSSQITQDILERLDRIRLPREADKPIILHFDPTLDPVMQLSFSGAGKEYKGEEGLRKLRRIADLQIKRFLEPIPGIAAVRVRGGLEEEIHIRVDEKKLIRSQLTISDVITRVRKENINMAGGTLSEGGTDYTVRTLNEFKDLDQIRNTIIKYINGTPVRISDIGTVQLSYKEREIITTSSGRESVQIDIYKEADANMVALSKDIRALVGKVEPKKKRRVKRNKNNNTALNDITKVTTKKKNNSKPKRRKGSSRGSKRNLALAPHLYKNENALLTIVSDRSVFIDNAISEVKKTAFIGGLLAVLVLFLFLRNIKSTLIIAVSIPISILITFSPMYLSGVTLNIMSLGGLALGIGMLVDSSIVVLESIYRCQEEGDDLKQSVIRGTKEVRSAVFASVLTSIAVFFPMVFVEGIAGQAFGDLGIAVVISLLVSFLVAVTFIPMLVSRKGFSRAKQEHKKFKRIKNFVDFKGFTSRIGRIFAENISQIKKLHIGFKIVLLPILYFIFRAIILISFTIVRLIVSSNFTLLFALFSFLAKLIYFVAKPLFIIPATVFGKFIDLLTVAYQKLLIRTLHSIKAIYFVVLGCFVAIVFLVKAIDTELLPQTYQGEFTIEISLPIGTPLSTTVENLKQIETRIIENYPEVKNLLVTYGYDASNSQSSNEGEHTAKFNVILSSKRNIKKVEEQTIEALRSIFSSIPDAEIKITRPVLFSQTTPIEVEIYGNNLQALKEKTLEVKSLLQQLNELSDVDSSLKRGAPEIQVVYDRNKMIKQGLNVGTVAEMVRDMVKGYDATSFNKIDRRIPIIVRLDEIYIEKVDQIKNLIVNPKSTQPIPLYAVAELISGEGPSEVRRINSQRAGVVYANLGKASLSAATDKIKEVLSEDVTWDDMSFTVTGQNEEWDNTKLSLYLALALSVFLVYVIMASQFESFIHPLIIMFSIPLAFIGTLIGLWWLNINISIVVMLGIIMLTGLVVNNAIVLVDYVNTLRAKGMALYDAIIQAGCVRLRPILMTTATTILGLLPMAIGLGDGSEIRTPMAIAVIFGLFSSTLLTLFVIPTILYSVELLKIRLMGEVNAPTIDADASKIR